MAKAKCCGNKVSGPKEITWINVPGSRPRPRLSKPNKVEVESIASQDLPAEDVPVEGSTSESVSESVVSVVEFDSELFTDDA